MRSPTVRRAALAVAAVAVAAGVAVFTPARQTGAARVVDGAVEVDAVVDAAAFARGELAGYHAVAWRGGRAAGAALLRAEATDVEVLDALESLGAVPGDGLDLDAWEERHDPAHPAPRRTLAGPPVEVALRLPGRQGTVPLADVLDDPGGRGLEFRLGGHRAHVAHWRSGCVVCLYACPGSKVGNATYTIRDFVDGVTRFRVRPGALPADGTRVTIVLRPLPSSPSSKGANAA